MASATSPASYCASLPDAENPTSPPRMLPLALNEDAAPADDPPPPYPSHSHQRTRRTHIRPSRAYGSHSSAHEGTPLLERVRSNEADDGSEDSRRRRKSWRDVLEFVLFSSPAPPPASPSTTTAAAPSKLRLYFTPFLHPALYFLPLLHLVSINFLYALVAWIYLFLGTVLGTTLLVALPLGALLSWLNLVGGRLLAKGELSIQAYFHRPDSGRIDGTWRGYQVFPPAPPPSSHDLETGATTSDSTSPSIQAEDGTSFYRRSYTLFTSPLSYQSLFYFLVVKPALTLPIFLFTLLFTVILGVGTLGLGLPIVLRVVRRVGRWQSGVGKEGLCVVVR